MIYLFHFGKSGKKFYLKTKIVKLFDCCKCLLFPHYKKGSFSFQDLSISCFIFYFANIKVYGLLLLKFFKLCDNLYAVSSKKKKKKSEQ